MAAQRVIFHCDCNSFYASVELLTRPELKNVPVAVCGNPQHRHGIILAKNEAAKKYGIQTAETVASARRKCPQLALLPPHHELYRAYSKQVNAIYARYTEFVEPFGIDESWLDMTASWHLFGPSPVAVAHRIRREVKAQTGLTISVGISFTKAFAKLGSDYKKPDAVTEFSPENYRQLVWPLPQVPVRISDPFTLPILSGGKGDIWKRYVGGWIHEDHPGAAGWHSGGEAL